MSEAGEDAAAATASPANPVRGEVSVPLGEAGREFVLRPDYTAIQAIEDGTGKGMMRLFRDCAEGNMTLAETATVVAECVKAQGRATGDKLMALYAAEKLVPMIVDSPIGLVGVQGRVSTVLGFAICGDYNSAGELKAAAGGAKATG